MMRARLVVALALASATALGAVGLTNASWTDHEWAGGAVATDGACGADSQFATTASARFLSGRLLGTNLDAVASLTGVAASAAPAAAPTDATTLNPLNIGALGVIGIDLSGLSLGLPIGSAGAVNQYARVANTGYSAGASGLVDNSGGVGVTPTTPSNQLPQPATISLAGILPVTNITGLALKIGAVGASSTLDWCAATQAALWGGTATSGSVRQYGIAGMNLTMTSPLLSTLTGAVNSTVTSLGAAVTALTGPTGSISTTLKSRLTSLLGALGLGTYSASVAITGLDLHTTIDPLLTQTLTDGVVSVNLANGAVDVDLARLLGGVNGLNSLAPNTQLVINAAVINSLNSRVASLLNAWTTTVTTALTAAIRAATLTIAITATAQVAGIDIISLGITGAVGLGAVLGSTATLGVTATVLPLLPAVQGTVNTALALLGLGSVSSIATGLVSTLSTGLLAPVTALLASTLIAPVTALGTTLGTLTTPLTTALSAVFTGLPGILSIMVNVQPDLPGAPPGSIWTAAVPPRSSQQFTVSALRLGVLDALGGSLTFVSLATATAGVNSWVH